MKTSNLDLAAFLSSRGAEVVGVTPIREKRGEFEFKDVENIEDLCREFEENESIALWLSARRKLKHDQYIAYQKMQEVINAPIVPVVKLEIPEKVRELKTAEKERLKRQQEIADRLFKKTFWQKIADAFHWIFRHW
jgi:hypothetical protein